MEIAVDIFRFLHFIGLAALLGGLSVQLKRQERRVTVIVLSGVIIQFATGIILLLLTLDTADHLKVTVKIVILAAVLIIVLMRKNKTFNAGYYHTTLAMTIINTGIAVFW
ncbi:MAG: hypothetical protein ACLFST_03420 [Spirochaetia bacterium]